MRTVRNIFLLATVSLLLAAAVFSQAANFENAARSVTLPIDIDNNIIRMKVSINGSRPLTMIFDTGASMTSIDERLVAEFGLQLSEEKLKGNGIGGGFTGGYVKSVTLAAGGASVSDQPLAAFKLNQPPGFDFDGVIGYDFIRAFVVTIDYQKKTLTLTDPKTYAYRGKGTILPIDLNGRKTPLIRSRFEIRGHATVTGRLEIDSGFDGAFRLNSPFVKKQRLIESFRSNKNQVSHGAGGDDQNALVMVRAVTLGPIRMSNAATALSLADQGAGASTASDGLVGGEVLRRFRVTIDYSRSRLILEPNSDLRSPFDVEGGI